jgi:hypothetical protein
MKKIFFFAIILFSVTVVAQTSDTTKKAMNPKFVAAMQKQVDILDTAFNPVVLQNCYNAIERISNAEKGEWLPDYYMAYCLIMQSYSAETSQVDDYCDKADQLIKRADSLSPKNSELYVLHSMSAGARIVVSPMKRGAKFGKISSAYLDTAQTLDANNPRIYLMRGQGYYYTPPAFGGGKDKAKPVFEDAITKYGTFIPPSTIHPHWGKARAQQLLDDCNKPSDKKK